MKVAIDKIITGFFVMSFGIIWYCSIKSHIKPEKYSIVIHNAFREEVAIDGIRTEFETINVARSYLSEYQKRFPHYDFSVASPMPEIKSGIIIRILETIQR